MGKHVALAAALYTALFTAALLGVRLAAQSGQKTTWDGVYTSEQAARGEAVYKKECTLCHSDNLKGNIDGGPPLRGKEFFTRWNNQSMNDMISLISEIMPNDEPGSLKRQEYVDIVTFLLKFNGFPAGATELPVDEQGLTQIIFKEAKP
jgi:cytochrome c